MSSRRLPLPSILAAATVAALLSMAPALPAAAYPGCSDSTPAVSAPAALWGGLRPAADEPFADTTHYTGRQLTNSSTPLWSAIDVEGGRLFASFTGGFAVYDLADPANPQRKGILDMRTAAFPRPITWHSEVSDYLYFVDAPRGRNDVAVIAGLHQMGLSVIDTSAPNNPIVTYQDSGGQDPGKIFTGVYTAEVGNRLLAFAGVSVNAPGLHVYDLDRALGLSGVGENSFVCGSQCSSGVPRGTIDSSPVQYVNGIDLGGGRHLVVTSGTSNSKGLKVWEISPASTVAGYQATQRVDAFGGETIFGVAVWRQGSKTYLAARKFFGGQIYDISSCVGGSCGSLAGKEVGGELSHGFISGWQSITFSRAGNRDSGTPFLYFGNDGKCHQGFKKEWLYDVSNPAAPVEVTGNQTLEVTGSDGGTGIVDYWSYSYSRNPSGFSQVMPRMGQFAGDHFYRAAWTIMEAHVRQDLDPSVGLSGPLQGYATQGLQFTASASHCTPSNLWDWSAPGAVILGSGSTVTITWPLGTLGNKTVTATNDSCPGTVAEHVVALLDPEPAIGSVTVSPPNPFVCQPITFSASGVTGLPPLARSWRVEPAAGGTATQLPSSSDQATWTPPSSTTPGTYHGILDVTGVGTGATKLTAVTVQGLPALPAGGTFAPTANPFAASTVEFEVNVPGATEWAWDFDGDGVFDPFTSDPIAGPNPTFTYTEEHVEARCNGNVPCTFPVRVKVKNCVEGERTSDVFDAIIHEINPLEINGFDPVCPFGCLFETGDQVTFRLDVEGDPEEYLFDWTGNGTFQAAVPTACAGQPGSLCATHTYTTVGNFTAQMKLVRGSLTSDPMPASDPVRIVEPVDQPPPPPPPPTRRITVSGPSSGNVGQALTFSASATGCSASASGWTWDTAGGTGSSNTSSISITFGNTGTRTVTARNSGCSGVTGSRTVAINAGNQPPTLTANFTFSPALPRAGQTVSFNGAASTGAPEFFYWKIDGQTIEGSTLQHTFPAAGSYAVTLEVSKRSVDCLLGMCTATATKTVAVLPATDPDPDPDPDPPPVLDNGCAGADAENPSLLCLLDGRFRIQVDWVNQHANGETGPGRSVRSAATADTTGFFWFFNADNIELLVKMLDGTSVNGHYWFFHGAVSDLFYEITVEDTVTGASRTYTKLAGPPSAGGDAAAFPAVAAASGASSTAAPQRPTGGLHQGGGDGGGGEPSDHLVLLDGRFEVSVDFLNQHAGDAPGQGRAVAGTNNAGYFWFFTQDNLELVVKMIDARPFDGHFWVFWTGLSDVKYNIEVKDLETGEVWEFHNPAGKVGGGADTSAFGD